MQLALSKGWNDGFRKISENLALIIGWRKKHNFVDTRVRETLDPRDNFLWRANDARVLDRFGCDEDALFGL